MKKTNKKFDNIFCGLIFLAILGFAFYMGGFSGVFDTIIVFIQESFKVLLCSILFLILFIFFPKIRKLFEKSEK